MCAHWSPEVLTRYKRLFPFQGASHLQRFAKSDKFHTHSWCLTCNELSVLQEQSSSSDFFPGTSGYFPPSQTLKPTSRLLSVEPSCRFSRLQGINLFRVRCSTLRLCPLPSYTWALQGFALKLRRLPLPVPAVLALLLHRLCNVSFNGLFRILREPDPKIRHLPSWVFNSSGNSSLPERLNHF